MSQEVVLEIINKALMMVLMVSMPLLLAGLLVGLFVAIFQAVTQIHEMTLTFIPKIIAIFMVLILLLPWIVGKFVSFTTEIFNYIAIYSH